MSEPLSKADTENARLPSYETILLRTSLYAPLPAATGDTSTLINLRARNFQIDAYCVRCERSSIFKTARPVDSGTGSRIPEADWMFKNGQFAISVICQRCGTSYSYYFIIKERVLIKIGQYPSVEDIISSEMLRYKGLLDNSDFVELRKAGGLHAHGIGVGSFVYLRRIFERLIESHRIQFETTNGAIEGYDRKRMVEKIEVLASVLPPALVKNRAAYPILSKGIHELSEDDCLAFFPVIRSAIIQILEQDLRAKEEERAAAELEKAVADIASRLS